MADSKISALTALTAAAAADVLPIVDTSATATKKMTIENIFKSIPVSVGVNEGTPLAKLHVVRDAVNHSTQSSLAPIFVEDDNSPTQSDIILEPKYLTYSHVRLMENVKLYEHLVTYIFHEVQSSNPKMNNLDDLVYDTLDKRKFENLDVNSSEIWFERTWPRREVRPLGVDVADCWPDS